MSFGLFTANAAGDRTSWIDNYTLQLYEEMIFTQITGASVPNLSYRPFTNYGPNGLLTGDSVTVLQAGILRYKDHTTVFLFPELDHIPKQNITVFVEAPGVRWNTITSAWETFATNTCPAWGYRILKTGDRIAFNPGTGGAVATTTSIVLDCASTASGTVFKLLRMKIYIKGEV